MTDEELMSRAMDGERIGTGNRQMTLMRREILEQREREQSLIDQVERAIALSDTGSPEHREAFDPDGVGEIPTGWRVVERMREVLIDGV